MAADPALPMSRLAGSLKACFVLVSQPDALPEMRALQVRLPPPPICQLAVSW